MKNEKIKKVALILLIIVLSTIILIYGKPFLVPLVFAALLASMLLPAVQWMEKKGIHKGIATIISILLLVGTIGGVVWLLSWQVSDLIKDSSEIEKELTQKYHEAQRYITDVLGVSEEKQKEMINNQKSSAPAKVGSIVTTIMGGITGFLTDTILTVVYIFLFLYYRSKLKQFIVKLVAPEDKENALEIVGDAQQVTQKYLTGLALMIFSLWIMYGIGFTLVGVKSAIFFAILCGLLEIVPFVGNITGTSLTILYSFIQGGDFTLIIGILFTYGLVQFIQTYILEPLVVGAEVNLNPLFTIIALIAGEMLWGIPGMILAIPLMGITKIVSDHVEVLKPFGELIGIEKKEDSGFKKKIKSYFKKIKGLFTS